METTWKKTKKAWTPILFALGSLVAASAASASGAFELTSSDVKDGGTIGTKYVFNSFGCTGKNVSPELKWTGAPEGTKGFAVTVYDPDAPTGSGWWHWTVFNLPSSVTELPSGAGSPRGKLPKGAVQGRTDFGKPGYGGPCPPAGDPPHHYVFTVYALKVDHLDLDRNASGANVGFALHSTTLGKASFTALYGR